MGMLLASKPTKFTEVSLFCLVVVSGLFKCGIYASVIWISSCLV